MYAAFIEISFSICMCSRFRYVYDLCCVVNVNVSKDISKFHQSLFSYSGYEYSCHTGYELQKN
jgi:hypothetical protein